MALNLAEAPISAAARVRIACKCRRVVQVSITGVAPVARLRLRAPEAPRPYAQWPERVHKAAAAVLGAARGAPWMVIAGFSLGSDR